jgi:hypothetical protein
VAPARRRGRRSIVLRDGCGNRGRASWRDGQSAAALVKRAVMAHARARPAVLGFSPHTGWAAVLAVAGPREAPTIVAKGRVELATTFETGAVYHMCQKLRLDEAEALVRSSEETFTAAARARIAAIVAELRGRELEPVASAVLAGAARPLPSLEAIVRSHALVHSAEGQLYRRVLVRSSEECAIPAMFVAAQELAARVARATGLPEKRIVSILADIGKASGKPWTKDEKEAALAAWLTLAGGAGGASRAV